jgi:LytS/YehU family sensor histidine kinase
MYYLNELIDINVLQEIQDKFADATGLAFVAIDYAGKPITRLSNFTDFCAMIRTNEKYFKDCAKCDAHGGIEAASSGAPYVYKCHCGLIDFAVPIIANGQYIASILGGQVKTCPEDDGKVETITKQTTGFYEDEAVMEAYGRINVIPFEKIKAVAELMSKVTNYMVDKTIMNMAQEELNNKNLRLMEEIQAKASLEKSLKDSEIKALQSQINPHFTFNVLNTIVRLAIIEKADKTQELTYLFAELLRYVVRNVNNEVSVEDEINQIRRFFGIQSIRFGEKMQFNIDVDPAINIYKMPSMIIQPMVENAMVHGIENREGTGIIFIRGYQNEKDIIFEIIDNGIGMSERLISQVLSRKNSGSSSATSTGIGIANTNERLILGYGPDYAIQINSRLGEGTTVIIKIPK